MVICIIRLLYPKLKNTILPLYFHREKGVFPSDISLNF
ncbi:hypothetical protein BCAH1134_C0267 (plasmid) [Bacillus cereus AH1134]|nr:hypothetical protein BCAH1134_C0267 [Bacillus cereus AH1134]